MIAFNFIEVKFEFDEALISNWLKRVVVSEQKALGSIVYVFCNDDYLLKINKKYLDHNTLTDIITFDSCIGKYVSGDIFISSERIAENASIYDVSFEEELLRVLVHGVLHLCGYKDKSVEDAKLMTQKENEKINLFHVEQ